MTDIEFNSQIVQELGFTLVHWEGRHKPGDVDKSGLGPTGGKLPPIRVLGRATARDWKQFAAACIKIGYGFPTVRPRDTYRAEAAD